MGGIANVLGVGVVLGTLANSVSVGGSSNDAVMKKFAQQRIMMIPPHSKGVLREYKTIETKKDFKVLQEPYKWYLGVVERGVVKRNQYKEFNENETPQYYKLLITYSLNRDFSTYSTLYSKVYVRYVTGNRNIYYVTPSLVPDMWDNPYRLIGEVTKTTPPKKK